MALIVEDGTGVTGANSYADLATIRAYAEARQVTLPADPNLEAMVFKGMDYLEGKKLGLLSLSWPLDDDKLCNKVPLAETLARLQQGLAQLCMEQQAGVDLAPTRTDAFVVEETVGPLTTKYSTNHGGGPGAEPDMLTVDNLLKPLIAACGQVGLFTTLRV
jgi:hypothetical protein